RIQVSMKNQGRLREVWKGLESAGVFHKLETERHFTLFAIVKNGHGAARLPFGETLRAALFQPSLLESEGGGQQDQTIDFRMTSRIQSSQVPAKTGSDQQHRFMARQPLNQFQLPADRKMLKAALSQIWYFDGNIQLLQFPGEEPGFA